MKLAHEIPPPARGAPSGNDVLFRWNKTDVSQFALLDPLNHGWKATFSGGDEHTPPHIYLSVPNREQVGPAFLLTHDLPSCDHVVSVAHTILPGALQTLGIVDRYAGVTEYSASVWTISDDAGFLQSGTMTDGVWHPCYSGSPTLLGSSMIHTFSFVDKGFHGSGIGHIAGAGFSTVSSHYLRRDTTAGFSVLSVTGVEEIAFKVFEVVVRAAGGV